MAGMLSPYRILDLTDERSNLTGLLLAQLGAEVVAIEPEGGTHSRQVGPFAHDEEDGEKVHDGLRSAARDRHDANAAICQ